MISCALVNSSLFFGAKPVFHFSSALIEPPFVFTVVTIPLGVSILNPAPILFAPYPPMLYAIATSHRVIGVLGNNDNFKGMSLRIGFNLRRR